MDREEAGQRLEQSFDAGEGEDKVQDIAVGSWQRSTRNVTFLSQPFLDWVP